VPREPFRIGLQQSDGVIAAGELLSGHQHPGAVVWVADDLAITGFDDVAMSSLERPGLTTIRQPVRELGAATARLLISGLGGPGSVMNTVLATELVLRGSCGCAL
jgi:LacI family transcriptional regulator